jgi:hypothetical protein
MEKYRDFNFNVATVIGFLSLKPVGPRNTVLEPLTLYFVMKQPLLRADV